MDGRLLVLKNLLRRRTRSLLSLLGIALGIAAIIAFHAVGRGFKDSLERYMHESGATREQLGQIGRIGLLARPLELRAGHAARRPAVHLRDDGREGLHAR